MTAVVGLSARRIAQAVATGEMSAREVTQAALERIEAVEQHLNALSECMPESALAAADAVDAARARGDALGPLAGVPITTKNNVDQAGTRNTGGIRQAAGNICAEDSPLVANLKAAGAIVIGRSNVPAFSLRWFTDTSLHGRTLNPYGAQLSPGGSSGGAAVAVATGMGALAHGNDIGGSIRFPAYANGVVGLRPTVGRVPSFSPSGGGLRALTSQLITAEGPLGRSVEDCRMAMNAMASPSIHDPQHVPMPPVEAGRLPEKVGLVFGSALGTPAPETRDALTRAAQALASAGAVVEEVSLPHFEQAHVIWQRLLAQSVSHHYLDAIRASEDTALLNNIDTLLGMTPTLDAGALADLWAQRLQIMRAWSVLLQEWPVLLMPVSYRHGLKVDADQGDAASLQVLFDDQSPLLATALMGAPGLSVPTGLAEDGAPTGVQLIARWWDEATLLGAGAVIEAAMPQVEIVAPRL